MIVHAFMIELENQTIDIQERKKKKRKCKNLRTKSMEGCSLECGITDSGRVPSRESNMQNFA